MLKTSPDEGPDSQCNCERNALTSPAPPVLAAPPLLPPPSTQQATGRVSEYQIPLWGH